MVTVMPVFDHIGDLALWHVAGDSPIQFKVDFIKTLLDDGDERIIVDISSDDIANNLDPILELPNERILVSAGHFELTQDALVESLRFIKNAGYGIAFTGLDMDNIMEAQKVIIFSEIAFISSSSYVRTLNQVMSKAFPNVLLGCDNISNQYEIGSIADLCVYYSGSDFPIAEFCQDAGVHPLSYNYTQLLKLVNEGDFDFGTVAEIVEKDPYLSVNLVAMANRVAANKGIASVRQAAAMLGQREIKRWINVSVVSEMCSDTPSEVMRLSLTRARFLENLAPHFGFFGFASELFLCGLLSMVDVMLLKPMDEAMDEMGVAPEIRDALVDKGGKYGALYKMVLAYETADFDYVKSTEFYDDAILTGAYLDAVGWYKMVISGQ